MAQRRASGRGPGCLGFILILVIAGVVGQLVTNHGGGNATANGALVKVCTDAHFVLSNTAHYCARTDTTFGHTAADLSSADYSFSCGASPCPDDQVHVAVSTLQADGTVADQTSYDSNFLGLSQRSDGGWGTIGSLLSEAQVTAVPGTTYRLVIQDAGTTLGSATFTVR